VMAYGVVLFTLLVQGTTMGPLLRFLRVKVRRPEQVDYERRHARLATAQAAEKHLDNLRRAGTISTHAWEKMQPELAARTAALQGGLRAVLTAQPALEAEELDTAWREVLRAERSGLQGLQRDGVISDEVFEGLAAEVDAQLQNPNIRGLPPIVSPAGPEGPTQP
ncbi:MAG: hypothetical protein ABI847_14660, partial [Anaerolineales bacterium]